MVMVGVLMNALTCQYTGCKLDSYILIQTKHERTKQPGYLGHIGCYR